MTLRTRVAASVTRLLGTAPIEALGVAVTAARPRTLAYHGVPDRAAFAAQVDHLVRRYRPVSGAAVADALAGGPALPPRSVWITFDDGDPSVVSAGLPVLAAAGVPATVFVCPGLVSQDAPPWWRVVERAGELGSGAEIDGRVLRGRALVRALKRVPDSRRRAVVAELVAAAPDASRPAGPLALSRDDLSRWLDAGLEIGNHTWDHPCLDRCAPEEQGDQVRRAHEWLVDLLGQHPRLFAYPNGDRTDHAEAVLAALGYEVGLLFDHHLGAIDEPPLRRSRLRLDADAPLWRARAVLGGAHGALLGTVG